MSTATAPAAQLDALAKAHGLTLEAEAPGTDFSGNPIVRATMTLASDHSKRQELRLSDRFDASNPKFTAELTSFFEETAQRLRNPRPDCYFTLLGHPLSIGDFEWPFHASTSGADTFIVHGQINLETGGESTLYWEIWDSGATSQDGVQNVATLNTLAVQAAPSASPEHDSGVGVLSTVYRPCANQSLYLWPASSAMKLPNGDMDVRFSDAVEQPLSQP